MLDFYAALSYIMQKIISYLWRNYYEYVSSSLLPACTYRELPHFLVGSLRFECTAPYNGRDNSYRGDWRHTDSDSWHYAYTCIYHCCRAANTNLLPARGYGSCSRRGPARTGEALHHRVPLHHI